MVRSLLDLCRKCSATISFEKETQSTFLGSDLVDNLFDLSALDFLFRLVPPTKLTGEKPQ